jgi:hypothetical protein
MTNESKLTRALQAYRAQEDLVSDLECQLARSRDELRRQLGDIQELRHQLHAEALRQDATTQNELWEE